MESVSFFYHTIPSEIQSVINELTSNQCSSENYEKLASYVDLYANDHSSEIVSITRLRLFLELSNAIESTVEGSESHNILVNLESYLVEKSSVLKAQIQEVNQKFHSTIIL